MVKQLRDMLEESGTDVYFNRDDKEYRLYIYDHFEPIRGTAVTIYLTPDEMARYKHRPRAFLADYKYPVQSDWIVLWLNGLAGPSEFKDMNSVLVPSYAYIEDLYKMYRTLHSESLKASKSLSTK